MVRRGVGRNSGCRGGHSGLVVEGYVVEQKEGLLVEFMVGALSFQVDVGEDGCVDDAGKAFERWCLCRRISRD